MKKLKVALAVAFASTLTVALCACGGGKNKAEITAVSENQNVITLTDSDDAAALQQKLNDYKLSVMLKKSGEARAKPETISGSECEVAYQDNIAVGQVGTYFIVLKPTDTKAHRNPQNDYARIRVEIGHDWGEADGDGVETCEKCKATHSGVELTKPETLKFGDFHEDTKVLTAGEGGSIIKEFGSVNVNGRQIDVPTFTVGRLTKGTVITVTGRAVADKFDNVYYYFPIIGVADASAGQYTEGGTYQGTSVFVRNEGWTLLNGVGKENRMLAALAGGSSETSNYGSHINDKGDETTTRPEGYDNWKSNYTDYSAIAQGIPFASSDYMNWAVYSEGTIRQTPDYYPTEDNTSGLSLEMTWNYRLDGIMELTIANPVEETALKAYVRVPDNGDGQGYYDAIIHGDYMTYTINSASYITPLTLSSIEATADKEAQYLANTMLDFNDVTVQAKYEQNASAQPATGFDIYGFVESADGKDELKVGQENKKGTLYDLSVYPLQENMTYYKVVLTVGPYSQEDVIAKADFVSVLQNSLNSVVAYPVAKGDVTFAESVLSRYTFTMDGAGKANVALTGFAATLSEAQKTALGTTGSNYFAVRLYANEFGTKFNTAGSYEGAAYIAVGGDGAYADVVIVAGEQSVTLKGLQTTEIVLDLKGIQGVKATSVVTASNLSFNAKGEITVDYSFAAGTIDPANAALDIVTPSGTGTLYLDGMEQGAQAGVTLKSQSDLTASSTTLRVVLETSANNLAAASFFGNYTIRLIDNQTEEVFAQNIVKLNKSFATGDGTTGVVLAEDGKTLANVDGNTLYIAKIVSEKTNISASDLRVNGLLLNFNDGTHESVNIFNLTGYYREYAGDFTMLDPDLIEDGVITSAAFYVDGTIGNAQDMDYIAVVRYAVDLTKIATRDSYLFDVVGEKIGTYYEIKNGAVTVKSYDAAIKDQLVSEDETGSCYDGAYVAKAIKDGDKTVFFAGAHTIGGEHSIVTDGDRTYCERCGADMTRGVEFATNAWFGSTWQDNKYFGNGMVYEFTGTYKTFGANSKGMTILLDGYDGSNNNAWYEGYRVAGDGFGHYVLNNGSGGWGQESTPYFEGDESLKNGKQNFTNSLITEDHPYNTLNGAIASDGSAIDTEKIGEIMEGASFRYTVSRENDVITIRVRIYEEGKSFGSTPYIDYNFKVVCEENRNYKPVFTYFDNLCTIEDGKIDRYIGKLAENSVKRVGTDEDMIATISGSTVSVSGMAPTIEQLELDETLAAQFKSKGYTHLTGVEFEFTQPLVSTTVVSVEGCADAIYEFFDDRGRLSVIIPLKTDSAKSYTLKFSNLEASTAQCDLTVDLSKLAVSDYALTVEGAPTLTGGSFTVTFNKALAATDKLTIAGETKTVSEITANATVFGGLLKTTAKTEKSLTFEQRAFDFSKKLEDYELTLENAAGTLLVEHKIGIDATVSQGTIIDDATLIQASGSKLTFVFTQGVGINATKAFALNANMGGAKDQVNTGLLRNYDLTFTVKNTGVEFNEANALSKATTAIYSAIGNGVVVLTVDLSDLGIVKGEAAAEPAYGFEAKIGSVTGAYLVNAERALSAIELDPEAEAVQFVKGTCTVGGLAAKAYKATGSDAIVFWYNVAASVTEEHTWGVADANGKNVCSACGAVLLHYESNGKTVEKTYLKDVAKNGLTVSYLLTAIPAGDWDTVAVRPHGHALNVTSANLASNGLKTDDLGELKEQADALKKMGNGGNIYPSFDDEGEAWTDANPNTEENGFNPWASTVRFYKEGKTNYVTVSINATAGIQYYFNDILVLNYDGPYAKAFAALFLAMAEEYGVDLAAAGLKATNALVLTHSVAVDACGEYKAYAAHVGAYPAHVHVFDDKTDLCKYCGVLNPNHGDTANGGLAHKYENDVCTICGQLNPNHTHDFDENAVCLKCHMVCKHTTLNEGICSACGMKPVTAAEIWNSAAWTGAINKGEKKEVIGTLEKTQDDLWAAIVFEVALNWTMTSADNNWLWANGDGNITAGKQTELTIKNAENKDVTMNWDIYTAIHKSGNATWKVTFDWAGNDLVVKIVYTTRTGDYADYSYTCAYTLTVKEGIETFNVQVGGDHCNFALKEVVPFVDAQPAE